MRMQESFKGDTESPNKRHMKKLGVSVILLRYYFKSFFDRFYQLFYLIETMQFMVFKRFTPLLPVLINHMKGKKFSVNFLNYKAKVQFPMSISPGALSLVLAFLCKTGPSSTEATKATIIK